jgi:hypothetical protein
LKRQIFFNLRNTKQTIKPKDIKDIMPKSRRQKQPKPKDYQQGKIYKIECRKTKRVYIGSTCSKYLSQRKGDHMKKYRKWKKGIKDNRGKIPFVQGFLIIDDGDYFFKLVERYPCNNVDELRTRERYWIENTPNCINLQTPSKTKAEWQAENRDRYKHTYQCVCGATIQHQEKARHERTSRHQRYVTDNIKHDPNRDRNESYTCKCGAVMQWQNKSRHERTVSHINIVKQILVKTETQKVPEEIKNQSNITIVLDQQMNQSKPTYNDFTKWAIPIIKGEGNQLTARDLMREVGARWKGDVGKKWRQDNGILLVRERKEMEKQQKQATKQKEVKKQEPVVKEEDNEIINNTITELHVDTDNLILQCLQLVLVIIMIIRQSPTGATEIIKSVKDMLIAKYIKKQD